MTSISGSDTISVHSNHRRDLWQMTQSRISHYKSNSLTSAAYNVPRIAVQLTDQAATHNILLTDATVGMQVSRSHS